jgi:hypothetical protein
MKLVRESFAFAPLDHQQFSNQFFMRPFTDKQVSDIGGNGKNTVDFTSDSPNNHRRTKHR